MILAIAILGVGFIGCAGGSYGPSAVDESITNNQEDGVDEGGIVKAWGDYLIVLRRGRIFTVRVGDRDLEPVCMVDAFPEGSNLGTWYDELLVSDNAAVVVGYSYAVGATELGLFELTEQGCIEHRQTYFLQSNDYYSSRNYASRVVEGHLVFYMPHYISGYHMEGNEVVVDSELPSFAQHNGQIGGYDWDQIITSSDVQAPIGEHSSPALHTVITCDLDPNNISCSARGMIGGYARTFYVSRDAVYVWISDGYYGGEADQRDEAPGVAYRLPLDDDVMGAVRVWGTPVDQFSFSERDETLRVVVRELSGGDWMWAPEMSDGSVALAEIPLAAFTPQGGRLKTDVYTPLPQPEGYDFRNRFIGDHLVYAGSEYWADSTTLYVHSIGGQGQTQELTVPHAVERIEAIGDDAVIIGPGSQGLVFSSVALDEGVVVDHFVQVGAMQGEQRSHGFFFKPDGEGRGVVGLPVQEYGGYQHGYLWESSVGVMYLELDNLRFTELGRLAATNQWIDDACVVSCVDWYGNSRPIFYRQRVFALMGYELVEGVIRNHSIIEVDRTNILLNLS